MDERTLNGNLILEQAIKAQMRSDVCIYFSFNLRGRWCVCGQIHAPVALTQVHFIIFKQEVMLIPVSLEGWEC